MQRKIFFLFVFLLGGASLYAQQGKLDITRLTDKFYVYTTYHTLETGPFPSNSLYVVTDSGVVMIDTPWDETMTQPLLDSIQLKHQKKVVACIVTHFHDDRTAGLDILKKQGVKTYSSVLSYQLGKKEGNPVAAYTFTKDTVFNFGNISFETYFPGEGHSKDNIVIWFPAQRILYGGCFVKSKDAKSLGFVGDANLAAWPVSVRNTIKKYKSPKFVIPGHQSFTDRNALMRTLYLLEHK